jgi:glycosyltransferase involved in cell wall biosynthesis
MGCMPDPRLSILVPNFNNGRESSRTGTRDFISDLFQSLVRTLEHDPTPLEIIVADDGSTDDSLATCRRWAQRTWRGGVPFCRLVELEHCGVLSAVANRMTADARGELCCRLDGDVIVLTRNWAAELCRIFDAAAPGLDVVGAKQLGPDGRVHSAGDWVLHPRGYHHVGQGAPRASIGRAIEVDHVMGCFYCHRRSVWKELGGYDETLLRGQTVDLSLRVRLGGGRIICTPTVEFVHYHAERAQRENRADSAEGLAETLRRFRAKWGFDRIAPDLEAVTRRHAGTPLLWNAGVFGPAVEWPPANGSAAVGNSEWVRFTEDPVFRAALLWRVELVEQVTKHLGPRRRVGDLYSRGGLLAHLLARNGLCCVGIDPDAGLVKLAESVAAREEYPGAPPQYLHQPDRRRLPFADGALDTLLAFDLLDRHPNPVGLFHEARRVLEPGGILLVVTAPRSSPFDGDHPACRGYRPHELRMQLGASGCFEPLPIAIDTADRGLLVVAARALVAADAALGDAAQGGAVQDDVAEQVAGGPGRVACDAPAGLVE